LQRLQIIKAQNIALLHKKMNGYTLHHIHRHHHHRMVIR